MSDSAPLLFIHYGPAAYLKTTLLAAVRSNPAKIVIFLGDETNRKMVPRGVEFQAFEPIARESKLITTFRSVFQPLSGAAHRFRKEGGTDFWLRFVFERWLILDQFVRNAGISNFWLFDSDTLIGAELASREGRLEPFDATEQCNGHCLNGFIKDSRLIPDYVEFMVGLFQNENYLQGQRDRLLANPGLAFTEMDAWQTFRQQKQLKTWHLQKPIDGEAFDDALGITKGWVTASEKIRGRIPIKKIVIDRRGGFFAFQESGGASVRMLTLNLSWLPDYCYGRFFPFCRPVPLLSFEASCCRAVNLREPVLDRLNGWWWKFRGQPFMK